MKPRGDRRDSRLVVVVHRDEYRALTRERVVARDLRLEERGAERVGDPHHLARGAHLGAEHGIELAELVEREHRLLRRDVGRHDLLGVADLLERLAEHHARGDARERHADRLAHERHRAARARIDLEHVDDAVLDRELHVDEPDDA